MGKHLFLLGFGVLFTTLAGVQPAEASQCLYNCMKWNQVRELDCRDMTDRQERQECYDGIEKADQACRERCVPKNDEKKSYGLDGKVPPPDDTQAVGHDGKGDEGTDPVGGTVGK